MADILNEVQKMFKKAKPVMEKKAISTESSELSELSKYEILAEEMELVPVSEAPAEEASAGEAPAAE